MRSCWLFPEPEPGLPSFEIWINFMMTLLLTLVMTMVITLVMTMAIILKMALNQIMLNFVSS